MEEAIKLKLEEAKRMIVEETNYSHPHEKDKRYPFLCPACVIEEALALLSKPCDDWIPVSERLPESGRTSLLYYKPTKSVFVGYWEQEEKQFIATTAEGFFEKGTITHWKPIPEEPDEDKPTCECGGSGEVYDPHETGGIETGDMIPCPKGCQPKEPKSDDHPFYTCDFCGCNTNAKLRACCDKGRKADLAKPKPEIGEFVKLATKGDIGPHEFDAKDCPTFYDGCHCTVETLEHSIDRCEQLKKKIKQIAEESSKRLKIIERAGWALGMKYPSENREEIVPRIEQQAEQIAELERDDGSLKSEISALEQICEHLQKYAKHNSSCDIYRPEDNLCSCGFEQTETKKLKGE